MKQEYIDTVRLLIEIAPTIFKSPHFAMKGGTAINLFVQDMPRLSVDIDVVFTDHAPAREEALKTIQSRLEDAAKALEGAGYSVVQPSKPAGEDVKLFVRDEKSEVKIEVNHVFRGILLPVKAAPLAPAAREMFTSGLEVPLLAIEEIYGSKLVAAMDRQHPRDIFDVMKMTEKFGLDKAFVDCFVDLFGEVASGQSRPEGLTDKHRKFLLSLVKLEPAWDLMSFAHLAELPALKWKLANLEKLKAAKPKAFALQHDELAERFGQ